MMTTRPRFMSPAATLQKGALLVFAFAVFATPVKANELWVAPAKNPADKLIGDFAAAQKKTHFGFGVPDNFNEFTKATVLLIGNQDQEIRYDLTLSISQNLASATAFVTEIRGIPATLFKDQLLELDVSAIFNGAPALQPGTDYVSLSLDIDTPRTRRRGEREGEEERNENLSNETGTPRALLFGLRFQYAGHLGPTGPEGPKGDVGPQGLPGVSGPPGLAGAMGPAGLRARSAWNAGTNDYVQNDVVTQGGETWRCAVASCTPAKEPSGTNPDWELLAAKGADGATGPTGPAGLNGLPGPAGPSGPSGPPGPPGTLPVLMCPPGRALQGINADGTPACVPVVAGLSTCGDGAGPGGTDVHCSCGDTVFTNTTLNLGLDPVTATTCTGNGLTLAAGVQLNLNGLTLSGSNAGNGLSVPSGGGVQGGTVRSFDVGVRVAIGTAGADVTVAGTIIENNAGDGALIDVADRQSRVVFDRVTVQGNGDDGIHVRGAPGSSNLDDVADRLERSNYGFTLQNLSTVTTDDTQVRNNGAHGIHLGDAAQPADVAALIETASVYGNMGAGIVMEQKTGLLPGADCGASAGQPGCTGATIFANAIHDNGGAGVELRSGFIIPLFVPGAIDHGLGFVSNEIKHNAMASGGCTAPQTVAQVYVTGPVGLSSATCTGPTSEAACDAANSDSNRHCFWTGTNCVVAWDLRGDVSSMCNNGLLNAIFDYNTSDTGNFASVGLWTTGLAAVWADNNVWRSADTTQNYTQAAGSVVRANLICSTRGTCLSQ